MERAAELLRRGRYNVTETAMMGGYNSISHFSQSFCQTIGCCPNLYPEMSDGKNRGHESNSPSEKCKLPTMSGTTKCIDEFK
jgi:AraC-like DNA-binding protein